MKIPKAATTRGKGQRGWWSDECWYRSGSLPRVLGTGASWTERTDSTDPGKGWTRGGSGAHHFCCERGTCADDPETVKATLKCAKKSRTPCNIPTAHPRARGPPPRRCAHLQSRCRERPCVPFVLVPHNFKPFFFNHPESSETPLGGAPAAAVLRHGGCPVGCAFERNPQREHDTHLGSSPPQGFESRPSSSFRISHLVQAVLR